MRIKVSLGIVLMSAMLLVACDDYTKDPTDVALLIQPNSDVLKVNAGDNVCYEIEMHTTHNYISRLQITSFDKVQGQKVVKDTSFTSMQNKYVFYYKAPLFNEGVTPVTLHFYGYDDAGSMGEVERYLTVVGRLVLLQEQTGLLLWNSNEGLPNAFLFSTPSQPYVYIPSDVDTDEENPSKMPAPDLYMLTDSDFNAVSLQSATNAKFVLNNSFDYANATANSIQSVYESSRRQDILSNLKINDIILVGHDNKAEGVMTITNITHSGTPEERSIRFSFKGIAN